ncbi:hypothetical protein F442_21891 [Phytophthora nicotianae P10297]|uniref:RxLR effector protein n=2 Tax=Phytophthora nicotianae TaxID=4792 RepID=W2Y185_PHYNI|nr:hypothetical protein L917_21150 [Phytophthora nicotianae]ETP28880.1 hypothetical protein F442_21891 [Phytophthora nicotianae P10297]
MRFIKVVVVGIISVLSMAQVSIVTKSENHGQFNRGNPTSGSKVGTSMPSIGR